MMRDSDHRDRPFSTPATWIDRLVVAMNGEHRPPNTIKNEGIYRGGTPVK
jgi:hypothetical protein